MQLEAKAAGAQRRELARRLVQGQLQIWKRAQAWLAEAGVEAGVAKASPQADGKGKQHAPQTSHQAKSHQQQRAAAAAAAPSQSGKRKRARERGCGGAK